jgi:hypothetical protein
LIYKNDLSLKGEKVTEALNDINTASCGEYKNSKNRSLHISSFSSLSSQHAPAYNMYAVVRINQNFVL